jgi:hypothetical protein
VGGLDGFSRTIEGGVRLITGFAPPDGENPQKSLPAQLAQPRDQR